MARFQVITVNTETQQLIDIQNIDVPFTSLDRSTFVAVMDQTDHGDFYDCDDIIIHNESSGSLAYQDQLYIIQIV